MSESYTAQGFLRAVTREEGVRGGRGTGCHGVESARAGCHGGRGGDWIGCHGRYWPSDETSGASVRPHTPPGHGPGVRAPWGGESKNDIAGVTVESNVGRQISEKLH